MASLRPRKSCGKLVGGDGRRLSAGAAVALRLLFADRNDGQAAEAAGIDEADLALVGEREHRVRVGGQRNVRLRDEQASGHAEVDEELRGRLPGAREVEDDRLAHAAHAVDRRAGERLRDLFLRGLEGLGLAAGPDAHDALPANARIHAIGDGFDLGKLGHGDSMRRSGIRLL